MYDSLIVRHEIESDIPRGEARNMFLAFESKRDFIEQCERLDPSLRTFHEVIFGSNPQRIKMDVDMKGIDKEEGDEMIRDLVTKLRSLFQSVFSIPLPERSVLVATSHRIKDPAKLSYHIIVLGYSMESARHVAAFVAKLKPALNPLLVPFVDDVYKSTQSFRILGCTKVGELRPKLVSSDIGARICLQEDSFISLNEGDQRLHMELLLPSYELRGDIPEELIKKTRDLLPSILPEIQAFKYRGTTGTIMNFDRISPSTCSLCNVEHEKENSLFLSLDGGILRQHCRRLQDTTAGARSRVIYMFETEEAVPSRLERLGKRAGATSMMDLGKYFEITERYNSPFLREIKDEEGVLYMKAPMKLGKTKCLKRYIEGLPEDVTICFVSFRVAFSNAILSVMEGFTSYQDIQGTLNSIVAPRLVVQVESLARVQGRYDLLVLDESESILSQFDSSCLKAKTAAIAVLAGMVASARRVICMDAMMTARTVEVIRKMREDSEGKGKELLSINEFKNGEDYTYELTYSEPKLFRDIINAVENGEKIVFVSNSVTKIEQYYAALRQRYPLLRMMSYTAKTDVGTKKAHMETINSVVQGLDVLMYSPTITAGVSIEVPHFDRVFSFFTNSSCDAISSIQMLGRIRNVGTKRVFICFSSIPRKAPCTLESIEKELEECSLELLDDATYLNLRATPMGTKTVLKAEKNMYYTMWLWNRLIHNQSLTYFEDFFMEYIASIGATVDLVQDDTSEEDQDNIKAEIREAKELAAEIEAESLASAPDITPQEVSALLACEDVITLENQRAIEKYKIKKFFGVKTLTVDGAKFLAPPRVRNWYTSLKILLTLPDMEKSVELYKEKEKERVQSLRIESRDYESYYLSDYPKHKACLDIFRLLGVTNVTKDHRVPVAEIEEVLRDKTVQSRLREIFRIFHVSDGLLVDLANMDEAVRDKRLKKIMRTISGILKDMYGLNLSKQGGTYQLTRKHPFLVRKQYDEEQGDMAQIIWSEACR